MMKKILLLQFFFLLILVQSYAQVYKKGNFVVDGYIGPNVSSTFARYLIKKYGGIQDNNSKISSLGPLGLRAEYLISKRIGIGLNFNYANTKVRGVIHETQDYFGNPIDQYYNFNGKFPRWRLFPTVSAHLGKSAKLDPYFLVGMGYNKTYLSIETADPYNSFNSVKFGFSHFSFRGEIGLRYFFMKNLGINAQLGYAGGSVVAAGISGKF